MDQPVDAVLPCPRGLMRCGRSSGVPAPAYGSGRRQQLPLRPLTLVGLRAQRMTDDPFPAANIGFHQGTPVVPRRFLPTHAAMFGNRLQMPVTRSGRILGRLARNGTRTRWHNDRCIGMAGSDLAVDAVLVVCTIAGQRSDGSVNLVEQGTDLRAVIDIIGSQGRRDDPTGVGIDTDVQFAPRPAPARTVILDQPFAGAS